MVRSVAKRRVSNHGIAFTRYLSAYARRRGPLATGRVHLAEAVIRRFSRGKAMGSRLRGNDSAFVAPGVERAQLGLEDLAVVVLRQAVDDDVVLGPLETGDRFQTQRIELAGARLAHHIG